MQRHLPTGATIALLLIALAILITANEIRFQGCIARQDRQLAGTADSPDGAAGITDCSRIPLAA